MLYLSLALIFLGILIFLYSIIVDTKKRHEEPREESAPVPPDAAAMKRAAGEGAGTKPLPETGFPERQARPREEAADAPRVKRPPRSVPVTPPAARRVPPVRQPAPVPRPEPMAVLFEDSSHVIDYGNESVSIDPSLEGYKNIRRMGAGRLVVEKGGLSFYQGKKLYRYDFHRLRDMKSGKGHLALFLEGSESVKLFIIEPESAIAAAADDAFREYLRGSA
jgi:hypothetical protein